MKMLIFFFHIFFSVGHGLTQGVVASHDDIFTNSSAERALFVQDFLGNLGIERYVNILKFKFH